MKHLLALLMAIMMVLTVVGCDSGLPGTDVDNPPKDLYENPNVDNTPIIIEETDEETTVQTEEKTEEKIGEETQELVVGTWVGVRGSDDDSKMSSEEAASFVLVVQKDGQATISVAGEEMPAEYEVKDGQLVITNPEELQFIAELRGTNILHIENLWDLGITMDLKKEN
ncbi:MAG: hypothetical protein IKW04_01530 [Clostridia bacterium]|nr:hypothetical protein [Clostridia bacterium]